MEKDKLTKILIITKINYKRFNKIKKQLKNEKVKIDYLNLYYLNKKIQNYNNLIFLIDLKLDEFINIKNMLCSIQNKYQIKNKKINIIFIKNNKEDCSLKILKNIFKKYNIFGKIQYEKKDYIFNKKTKNKIKKINK